MKEDKRVRDHNHFDSKFRGIAHESCNLNYQDSPIIPVVFHNLSCYDGHLLIKALASIDGAIDILPINKEKYMSFTKHLNDSFIQFRFITALGFYHRGLTN